MAPDTQIFKSFDNEKLTNNSNYKNTDPGFKKLEDCCLGYPSQFQEITETIETINKELVEKKHAYNEGFKDGKIAGEKEKTNILQNTLNHLIGATEDLKTIQKNIQSEMEGKIAALSIAIAEKIICQEVKIDEEIIVGVIKNALEKFDTRTPIKIKINPNDYSILKKYNEEMSTLNKFEYIQDPSITKGGFIIETRNGIIDASIEEQLDIIAKTFESISSNSDQELTI